MGHWRLYCEDCEEYKFFDQESKPTACPTNGEHTVRDVVLESESTAHWHVYCSDCSMHFAEEAAQEPSTCPSCAGSNISNVFEDVPCNCHIASRDGATWVVFMDTDGSMLSSKSVTR